MIYKIEIYFMLFIIYAFLGWVMECTLGVIQKHKFVNRGFLIGPYCPIYGVGVVGITLLLSKFSDNLILLFVLVTLLCGTLEYLTSYFMEKIFHARWWDYTNRKFNLNGRICLETLLPFGIIGTIAIKFMNPFFFTKLYQIPKVVLTILAAVILLIYIVDVVVSFNIILSFKNLSKKEKDNTEEISKRVKETAEKTIEKLKLEKKNLIGKIKIHNFTLASGEKYTRKKYRDKNDIKNRQITLVGTFKRKLQSIDIKLKNVAKDVSDKIAVLKESQAEFSKNIKEEFSKKSKLNKRLISAFPNVEQKDYTRKKKR